MHQVDFITENRATKEQVITELRTLRRVGLATEAQVSKAIWYLGRYPIEDKPEFAGMLPMEIADRILSRI